MSTTPKKTCSLSIELLPEFGWSIRNQPVYGPGSVFQGFINLNLDTPMPIEKIRLVFYAIEIIPSFESSPGVFRSTKKMIFSTQTVLWHSKQTLKLSQKPNHIFPFTIQMPMIQFPPSVEHTAYKCQFLLAALLDTPTLDIPLIKKEVPVLYMPFVETSLMKTPTVLTTQKKSLSLKVQMVAQEFVPGDNINLNLYVERSNNSSEKKSKNSLQFVTVHLKLIQTLSIRALGDIPDQTKCVASVSTNLLLVKRLDEYGTYCDGDLTLKIPYDIFPSYDYGKLANISYQLQITVEQKGPLGNIWKRSISLNSIHITIGTLGYGIRSSNEIKLYSDLETPISPLFMKAIEYEDALPLYDSSKLPSYENISSFQCMTTS